VDGDILQFPQAQNNIQAQSGDVQIRTIGYNFDKNIEQNIEIKIEQARSYLNHVRVSMIAKEATDSLLNSYLGDTFGIASHNNPDLSIAIELMLEASSLLENLLFKAPDFSNKEEWLAENQTLSKEIFVHKDDVNELYALSDQLKDLALRTAKKLGMVDPSIRTEKWERFLLKDSKSKSGTATLNKP
jgi:hypothetical protein